MEKEERIQENVWKRKTSSETGDNTRILHAVELLGTGKRLLDVRCGSGDIYDSAKTKFGEIYGIDISSTALNAARKKGLKTKKVNLNKEKIPFNGSFFDAVVCLDVIDYISDPSFLIAEIKRVLRIKGTLIVSFPNIRAISRVFSLAVRGRFPRTSDDSEHFDGGHIHYFTTKDVKEMLQANGFRVVKAKGMLPSSGKRKNIARISSKILGDTISRELILHGTIIKAVKQ